MLRNIGILSSGMVPQIIHSIQYLYKRSKHLFHGGATFFVLTETWFDPEKMFYNFVYIDILSIIAEHYTTLTCTVNPIWRPKVSSFNRHFLKKSSFPRYEGGM